MTDHAAPDPVDARLERELRRLLDDRDPGPAPYGLRGRIDRIPDETAGSSRARNALLALGTVAGSAAAAVAAIAVLGALAARPAAPLGPGSSVAPGVQPVPMGPGVVPLSDTTTWIIGGLAFAATALGLAVVLRVARRRVAPLALIVAIVVAAATTAFALMPGAAGTESLGTSIMPIYRIDMPPGYEGPQLEYITANPGDGFAVEVGIENTGLFPVRIDGLTATGTGTDGPRWVRADLIGDVTVEPNVTRDAVEPLNLMLDPGQRVLVRLVGTPGSCAIGSAFDAAKANSYRYEEMHARLAWSIAGIPRVTTIDPTSMKILVPLAQECPAQASS